MLCTLWDALIVHDTESGCLFVACLIELYQEILEIERGVFGKHSDTMEKSLKKFLKVALHDFYLRLYIIVKYLPWIFYPKGWIFEPVWKAENASWAHGTRKLASPTQAFSSAGEFWHCDLVNVTYETGYK